MNKVILRLKLTIKVVILTLHQLTLPTIRREIVNVLTEMDLKLKHLTMRLGLDNTKSILNILEVLKACDNIQIFKLVVKTIARKHGLYATFMAKPKYGIAGSGMHCNMSLFH